MKGSTFESTKGKIYGQMEKRRDERKDEKKKGSIPEVIGKGPKHRTSTPKSIKKVAKIDQKRAKIDPKGPQNGDKTDKKIKATSSR